jgi:hypothetical protein
MQLRPGRHRARLPRSLPRQRLCRPPLLPPCSSSAALPSRPASTPQTEYHDLAGSRPGESHRRRVARPRGHILVRKHRTIHVLRITLILPGVPVGAGMRLLRLSLARPDRPRPSALGLELVANAMCRNLRGDMFSMNATPTYNTL